MAYVNDHRIPLEVCLSSNVQTRAVRTIREHPFHFYFKQGLRVTLNTDSRLVSGTTLSHEISLAVRAFHLSPYEVKRIIINGFKSAFLTFHDRAQLIRRVQKEIAEVAARFAAKAAAAAAQPAVAAAKLPPPPAAVLLSPIPAETAPGQDAWEAVRTSEPRFDCPETVVRRFGPAVAP
jgi:adenosine deaminase